MAPPAAPVPRPSAALRGGALLAGVLLAGVLLAGVLLASIRVARGGDAPAAAPAPAAPFVPSAERGYRHILDTPYIPPTFDDDDVDHLYTLWPAAERAAAEAASPPRAAPRPSRGTGYARPDAPGSRCSTSWTTAVAGPSTASPATAAGRGPRDPASRTPTSVPDLVDDVARRSAAATSRPRWPRRCGAASPRLEPRHDERGRVQHGAGRLRDADLKLVLPKTPRSSSTTTSTPAWWNVKHRGCTWTASRRATAR
jgi:hypothetical protein